MTRPSWRAELERWAAVVPGSAFAPSGGSVVTRLPQDHADLIADVAGLTAFHGMFRLFGASTPAQGESLAAWNDEETWRFAWGERAAGFLFFGETVWGDQYAYRVDDDDILPEVYYLECGLLEPELWAGSFDEFVRDDFLRNAREPYDPVNVAAYARFGAVDFATNWVYNPSLVIGGAEDLDQVRSLPASTAMRVGGDIASAVLAAEPDAEVVELETWFDEQARARVRLRFGS